MDGKINVEKLNTKAVATEQNFYQTQVINSRFLAFKHYATSSLCVNEMINSQNSRKPTLNDSLGKARNGIVLRRHLS